MILSNIQSLLQDDIPQQSLSQIRKLFIMDTYYKSPNQIYHQPSDFRIIDQYTQSSLIKNSKNAEPSFRKLRTISVRPLSIQQNTTDYKTLKIDTKSIRTPIFCNLQKLNEMKQKLPHISFKKTISSKQEVKELNESPVHQRQKSYTLQQQKINQQASQILVQSVLPNIDDKPFTNISTNVSISPSKSHIDSVLCKGYLQYDSVCYSYFQDYRTNTNQTVEFKYFNKYLTANHYCLLDTQNLNIILNKNNQIPIQIASLTKIVTAFLTILICNKFNIDMKTFKCRTSEVAAEMAGTSAQLQVGDNLTIQQLLYGLLLPSGNDAATVLAENLGKYLQKQKKKICKLNPIKIFTKHMNILYHEMLGSQDNQAQHNFQNPSGLSLNPNITTAKQITIFSAVAMKNQIFRSIVSTKEYEIILKNQRYGLIRKLNWKNTNKLLNKDWEGVKTGTTETAGHCFIGKYQKYMVGIFDCATLSKRFNQATLILKWLQQE